MLYTGTKSLFSDTLTSNKNAEAKWYSENYSHLDYISLPYIFSFGTHQICDMYWITRIVIPIDTQKLVTNTIILRIATIQY